MIGCIDNMNPLEKTLYKELKDFPKELTNLISSFLIENCGELKYINGVKHGLLIINDPPHLEQKSLYEMGKLQGIEEIHSSYLRMSRIYYYKNGMKHGRCIDRHGDETIQYFYKNNILDGPACILYKGKIVGRAYYKNGKIDGELIYYKNNKITKHVIYKYGKKIHTFIDTKNYEDIYYQFIGLE